MYHLLRSIPHFLTMPYMPIEESNQGWNRAMVALAVVASCVGVASLAQLSAPATQLYAPVAVRPVTSTLTAPVARYSRAAPTQQQFAAVQPEQFEEQVYGMFCPVPVLCASTRTFVRYHQFETSRQTPVTDSAAVSLWLLRWRPQLGSRHQTARRSPFFLPMLVTTEYFASSQGKTVLSQFGPRPPVVVSRHKVALTLEPVSRCCIAG